MSIGEHCYITWKEEHCRELSVLHYLEGKALPRVITIPGRKSIANNYYLLGRKSIAENSRIVFAQAAVAPKRAQCYVKVLIYCNC